MTIPTFRAEYRDQQGTHDMIWNVRSGTNRTGHGKPTEVNAERLRQSLNHSFTSSGINHHVSKARGYLIHVNRIQVIRQSTGKVVAQTDAPMFEVV